MKISGEVTGVDTGDSFLAKIDSYMGAPPIPKKGGGSEGGKEGGGFVDVIRGVMQALGVGNKPITGAAAGPGKPSEAAAAPASVEAPGTQAVAPPGMPPMVTTPEAQIAAGQDSYTIPGPIVMPNIMDEMFKGIQGGTGKKK